MSKLPYRALGRRSTRPFPEMERPLEAVSQERVPCWAEDTAGKPLNVVSPGLADPRAVDPDACRRESAYRITSTRQQPTMHA